MFSNAQLYLQDNNNGQYNNYIQYITTTLKQQFIDYHNGYFWIPNAYEVLNTAAEPNALLFRAPTIAMRHSVLSLVGQLTVTTDQGQTLVNDNNTQMINNLRLEVENDLGWIWSEGQDLDFGLDGNSMLPNQGNVSNTSKLNGPSFQAYQGLEPGAVNFAPMVNDLNEFGNNTPGTFTVTYGAFTPGTTNPGITALNGAAIAVSATSNTWFVVLMPDGRIAYIPYTSGTTFVSSIGGVTVGNGTSNAVITVSVPGLAAGVVYTIQAVGWTNVLDQSLPSEEVTIPISFTGVSGTTAVVTSIGGQPLAAAGATAQVLFAYGQIAGRNPNFNRGFLDRVTVFQNGSSYVYTAPGATTPGGQVATFGGHTFFYEAIIPLKQIHDFFMQLNIPIINVGWNITLYMNQSNGAGGNAIFPPMQTSYNVNLITGGTDSTGGSTTAVGNPSIFYGLQPGGGRGTRLYYRSVKFSPADNARVAERLTTGFTKSIKFISTDWVQMNTLVGVNGGTTQYQIANSVVHPLRLWVLPYIVTGSTTASVQTTTVNTLLQPWYAPGVITGFFNQLNVLVNNIPYFRQNFQVTEDVSATLHMLHVI